MCVWIGVVCEIVSLELCNSEPGVRWVHGLLLFVQ